MIRRPPRSPLFPYTPLSRSEQLVAGRRPRAESGPDEPRVLRRRQPVLSAGPPPVRAKRELRLQRPHGENALAVPEQLDVVVRGALPRRPVKDRLRGGSRGVRVLSQRDDFRKSEYRARLRGVSRLVERPDVVAVLDPVLDLLVDEVRSRAGEERALASASAPDTADRRNVVRGRRLPVDDIGAVGALNRDSAQLRRGRVVLERGRGRGAVVSNGRTNAGDRWRRSVRAFGRRRCAAGAARRG